MRTAAIILQAATFVWLGALLIYQGEPKLGGAQLLLAGVTYLVYST